MHEPLMTRINTDRIARIARNLTLMLGLLAPAAIVAQSDLKLWYNKPAASWNEALPIGNGRLGAMLFGNVNDELIQLNEGTLWSGGPKNTNPNPLAPRFLPQIRAAVAAGDYKKADLLAKQMQGPFTESFEPLGDVIISQKFSGDPSAYYRDLDLHLRSQQPASQLMALNSSASNLFPPLSK